MRHFENLRTILRNKQKNSLFVSTLGALYLTLPGYLSQPIQSCPIQSTVLHFVFETGTCGGQRSGGCCTNWERDRERTNQATFLGTALHNSSVPAVRTQIAKDTENWPFVAISLVRCHCEVSVDRGFKLPSCNLHTGPHHKFRPECDILSCG